MKHILNFTPKCIQEENDKKIMLEYIEKNSNVYTRDNEVAHMTASSWIVNKTKTKVLMVYHNIYNSWSWTGGHMDGETDYLSVAIKEAKEETGITNLVPLNKGEIYSLEILPVLGHIKRGKYVSCHLTFYKLFSCLLHLPHLKHHKYQSTLLRYFHQALLKVHLLHLLQVNMQH